LRLSVATSIKQLKTHLQQCCNPQHGPYLNYSGRGYCCIHFMKRINIEILLRKVRRKENVYIAEIQEVGDGYYIVLTYGGPMNDSELTRLVHLTTEDVEKAQAVMNELLVQKYKEGFTPPPNGSDLHIPGFKDVEFNRAMHVPNLETENEHRRLIV